MKSEAVDLDPNRLLAKKVISKFPQNVNVRDYLVRKFRISNESAYRRMRGRVPFTFEEISEISNEFGFSMDEIIKKKGEIIYSGSSVSSAKENFKTMLGDYSRFIEMMLVSPNMEVLFSMNKMDFFFPTEYESLFKWLYYKWLHRSYGIPAHQTFAETDIPDDILEIRRQLIRRIGEVDQAHFIIHKDLFQTIVNEIRYFSDRRLISTEEMLFLKSDLLLLLENMEYKMQQRIGEPGPIYNFYLSLLDIESNSICIAHNDNIASLYWLYDMKTIIIRDKEICTEHLDWIESLKSSSALICRSNELLRSKFIKKQGEYIENITQHLWYYD